MIVLKYPGFGHLYASNAFVTSSRHAGGGTKVWMWHKGPRVRFYDRRAKQHGPTQSTPSAAMEYVEWQGWKSHPTNVCVKETKRRSR